MSNSVYGKLSFGGVVVISLDYEIDGKRIEAGQSYTFEHTEGGKTYTFIGVRPIIDEQAGTATFRMNMPMDKTSDKAN